MKKIFAIALALVMVLSMASAFAFVGTCGDYAYTCATVGCGVAKAEVVQFAANNTIDLYEETSCAAVVGGLPVFYGVQVTFDANVNEQWFTHANTKLEINEYNVTGKALDWSAELTKLLPGKTASDVSTKTFWYDFKAAKLVADWSADCVKSITADNTKVKVCADVDYVHDGVNGVSIPMWDYTDFDAKVVKGATGDGFDYTIELIKAGKTLKIWVIGGEATYAMMGSNVYYADNGTIMVYKKATAPAYANNAWTVAGDQPVAAGLACDDVDEYLALIGIKLGDCVTASTIKAIFGWDDNEAAEHCATWNKDAVAIVNSECQVLSIPKTGDASVLAWLF